MAVKEMTENNLRSAYAGESQAHMRYLIFADQSEKEGFKNISRLFRAIAFSEKVHATNHYLNILSKGGALTVSGALFGTRSTVENLKASIDGENFEVNEMYPAYKTVAKLQGESEAERSFTWALKAEIVHAELYGKALDAAVQGVDADLGEIHVCMICGYTIEGKSPDQCPICNASRDKFKTFK